MAKAKKKEKDVSRWKKKKWLSIIAPGMFNKQMLGQTTVFDPAKAIGKAIKINLMNLTGEVRNQNVNIRLKVRSVKEGQAQTEVVGYTLSPSFIKRVVRRRHTRIDNNLRLQTKDNRQFIVKPMMITRSKANRSEMTSLRGQSNQELQKAAGALSYDEFIKNLVHYRLQLDMRKRLSKIYPLKTFEIKKMDLVEPRQ
jgi:ribosomal protein S3AE